MNSNSLTTLAMVRTLTKTPDSNTTINPTLESMIDIASAKCQQYCRRKFRLKTYTEYYDGDGTAKLFLNQIPISSVTSLYDDYARSYGSTTLIASTDYVIDSDTGIITLDSFNFVRSLQNIKITYIAGYEEFEIIAGYNDAIDFNEGGAELNAILTAGTYTADELCAEIKTQLDDEGANTYTPVYNPVTAKFTIAADGTLSILWLSGTNTLTSVGLTIGFVITADDSGASTYTADNAVLGIPADLQNACTMLVQDIYDETNLGQGRQGMTNISSGVPGGGNTAYAQIALPIRVQMVLDSYRITLI